MHTRIHPVASNVNLLVTTTKTAPGVLPSICTKSSYQTSLAADDRERLDEVVLAKAADAFQTPNGLEPEEKPANVVQGVTRGGEIPGPENNPATASSSDVPSASGEAQDADLATTENNGRKISTAEKLETLIQR